MLSLIASFLLLAACGEKTPEPVPAAPEISFACTEMALDPQGGETTVRVSATAAWTVTTDGQEWFALASPEQIFKGESLLKVSAQPNLGGNAGALGCSIVCLAIYIAIGLALAPRFARNDGEVGIYRYAIAVTNFGFMGITIGPMIYELFGALIPSRRKLFGKDEENETWLAPESKQSLPLIPNPFKQLTKKQIAFSGLWSAISCVGFTMSPVGMTVLSGEATSGRCKELYERISTALSVEDSTSNATYIAGLIIPLLGLGGVAIGGVAAGPAAPLFATAPRFEIGNNLAQLHRTYRRRDHCLSYRNAQSACLDRTDAPRNQP